ncbi:FAM86B1 isoform 7 [Pan troglodytes]|uniref:FAM86B1 isoform 7 n=1 Tax=Pan troglodytes TaxID=9598 RepID=A0A2J8IKR7_PANTR|nr:FAM86B1 isoform 7 [Pan troglodytes]
MAPEENAGTELLLQGFDRRFLAARTLRSFPWQVGGGASGEARGARGSPGADGMGLRAETPSAPATCTLRYLKVRLSAAVASTSNWLHVPREG